MTYEEWEISEKLSPSSPEACYASEAWDKAIDQVLSLLRSTSRAEIEVGGLVTLLEEEIMALKSGP
ncbi:hypothetical protein TPMD04_44 [Thiohalocapsa phage LS06-2018-MD04]|nr:hypothetical protein TPMD04_44 [Thiohalocapsa phage LS06-2018-MD04]